MWFTERTQRGSVDFQAVHTVCTLSALPEDHMKVFFFYKENAAIHLEKIFSSLKLNASASITFCVPSASFFLRLKMTWNRSFKSITSGSACMETNTKNL